MSCLSEERFVEMLDGGGLEAATGTEQSHLESCDGCQDGWASVAAAAEVLGEARPRRVERFALGFPMLVAAAILLAIFGIILLQPENDGGKKPVPQTPEEIVATLVEGSEDESRRARELLSSRGYDLVPLLVACRKRYRTSPRYRDLQETIYALKRAHHADDPEKLAILERMDPIKITLGNMRGTLKYVIGLFREFTAINFVLDPGLTDEARSAEIYLDIEDMPLREALDLVCTVGDLDFDLRYGVVWISTPRRMWLGEGGDATNVLPMNNHWTDQLLVGEDKAAADKLRSLFMWIQKTMVDIMNEERGISKTVLLDDLTQTHGESLITIVDLVREFTGVKLEMATGVADRPISILVSNIPLEHFLELLTIPFGLDVRIEGGTVRVGPR